MLRSATRALPITQMLTIVAVVGVLITGSWLLRERPRGEGNLAGTLFAVVAGRGGSSTQLLAEQMQARLRANPDDWQAASQLGAAYLTLARETADPTYYARAETALQQALKNEPEDYAALASMGALALARHQFGEAFTWGERARAINPDASYAHGVVADALIELGRYDEAVQAIQTMVDLRPDLASYSRVSYARELHGDLDGAIETMQAAVSAGAPNDEQTRWVRVQLGNLYFGRGNLPAAEQAYSAALGEPPEYVFAQAGLARVRAAQGRTDEAVALYSQAIERVPLPEFVIALGETLEAAGRQAEAREQYALVVAMQQLFAAAGVDTDLELALFEADHGTDPVAAAQLAREAYERRPGIKGADTLAWALYKAGEIEEAQRYAQEALRLNTQDALLLYHAGVIAHAAGDDAVAQNYLRRALELNLHFSPLYAPHARALLRAPLL